MRQLRVERRLPADLIPPFQAMVLLVAYPVLLVEVMIVLAWISETGPAIIFEY